MLLSIDRKRPEPLYRQVIEAPTYALMIPLLRISGVPVAPVPMRDDGMDLDRLEKILDKETAPASTSKG